MPISMGLFFRDGIVDFFAVLTRYRLTRYLDSESSYSRKINFCQNIKVLKKWGFWSLIFDFKIFHPQIPLYLMVYLERGMNFDVNRNNLIFRSGPAPAPLLLRKILNFDQFLAFR